MAEKTLNEVISDLVTDEIQQQRPQPTLITITATHENNYIDIKIQDDIIKNIYCIGSNYNVGDKGILVYLNDGGEVVISK